MLFDEIAPSRVIQGARSLELEKWLSVQTVYKRKINMPPRDELLIILDLTTTIIRAGVGVHDLIRIPTVEISTRVGRKPAVAPYKIEDYVIGNDLIAAEQAGDELEVVFPLVSTRAGLTVTDWTGVEALFRHIFHTALGVPRPPLAHPVLLSLPPFLPPILVDQFHSILFERLLVPQLLVAARPFLATAAAGTTAAVVLDIGARGEGSEVSCVYESQVIESATDRIALDEGVCDDWLSYLLLSEDSGLRVELSGNGEVLEGEALGDALRKVVQLLKDQDAIGFVSPLLGNAVGVGAAAPTDEDDEGVLDIAKAVVEGKVDTIVGKKGAEEEDEEGSGNYVTVPHPAGGERERIRIGPVRHRHCEPLFLPELLAKLDPSLGGVAGALGWEEYRTREKVVSGVQEVIGNVVGSIENLDVRRALWEAVVVVGSGKLAGNKVAAPVALMPLLTPFVIDAESGSEVQPKILHFAKMPDYFSEFKPRGGELGVYLGGCIMAKILISDLQSKMFMAKGEYAAKGPAYYRLLEAL